MTGWAGHWADLARGAALGLAIAAPIGPTAMLCIQRTLAGGAAAGLATGYGAATAHLLYGSVAALGLTAVAEDASAWRVPMQLCCAAFLLRMAVRTVRRAPRLPPGAPEPGAPEPGAPGRGTPGRRLSPGRAYLTGLAWSLGNPMTLLGFATLAPGILGQAARTWQDLPALAAGVLLGSAAWWTALSVAVACARRRLGERGLRLANLATGVVLGAFALVLLAGAATPPVDAGADGAPTGRAAAARGP